ncbi:hypothetical protein GGR57DRAFT_519662 [Xylariaceae sp. FL1272]|nr:hypothetical protein GGR57DRAFT_519662 [Xylariaceae sp. FL1272]
MKQRASFGTKLPTELRLLVWEWALVNETSNDSSNRLIILRDTRVIPTKNLISPLLSTSRDSRYCALKFYDTKLTIYKIPTAQPEDDLFTFDFLTLGAIDTMERLGRLPRCCEKICGGGKDLGKAWGSIRISPDYDTFIIMEEPSNRLQPRFKTRETKFRDHPPHPNYLVRTSVTARLSPIVSNRIKKVVLPEPITGLYDKDRAIKPGSLTSFSAYASRREPLGYALKHAEQRWKKRDFPDLEYWGHLWFDPAVQNLEEDIAGVCPYEPYSHRLTIREWTIHEATDTIPEKTLRDHEGRKAMKKDYERGVRMDAKIADALEKYCMEWMESCGI